MNQYLKVNALCPYTHSYTVGFVSLEIPDWLTHIWKSKVGLDNPVMSLPLPCSFSQERDLLGLGRRIWACSVYFLLCFPFCLHTFFPGHHCLKFSVERLKESVCVYDRLWMTSTLQSQSHTNPSKRASSIMEVQFWFPSIWLLLMSISSDFSQGNEGLFIEPFLPHRPQADSWQSSKMSVWVAHRQCHEHTVSGKQKERWQAQRWKRALCVWVWMAV
jgi:hypothetical protein